LIDPGSDNSAFLDLAALAPGLERRDPGLWFARRQAAISYPARGNAAYFSIEDKSFWFRHRNNCIIDLVQRFLPNGVFFDIGGGNGYVSKGLTQAGVKCALIEPGIEGALAAHSRGIDPVICSRLEDLDLPPASMAAAGMFDVLEHLEDERAALRHVYTLLRSGGRLFLTVPAYRFLFSADDKAAGHFRRYTISSLTRVLLGSGFRVAFASYIFAPLPPLVFVLRTVPTWAGLRRGTGPDRDAAEHAPGGMTARVMDRLLAMELTWLRAGRRMPVGGSCLCVGVKP